jgi:hypothetical protein
MIGLLLNNELERIWKEVVGAYLDVGLLVGNLPAGKTSADTTGLRATSYEQEARALRTEERRPVA